MCFEPGSRPPVGSRGDPIDAGPLELVAADGNRCAAWRARPHASTGVESRTAVLVLPDQRGLHRYYEELAERFAELGYDALAVDWYGRTAGAEQRGNDFEEERHIPSLTYEGLLADVTAAVAELRSDTRAGNAPSVCIVGFCLGGRIGLLAAASELELAGVVAYYGRPTGTIVYGGPSPIEVIDRLRAPILGIFAERDEHIATERVEEYRQALAAAGADARILVYPDTPHSFFDMLASEYAEASADAWRETLWFVERVTSGSDRSS